MSEHEDFYTPEHVDEQVDALLQARNMSLRDQRLASDLHSILGHKDEDAYSLQRVLQKLMKDDTSTQQGKIIPFVDLHSQQQGRFVAMPKTLKQPTKTSRMKPVLRALTTLAAVLVVAVLVGSMLLVLNATRQKPIGTTTANNGLASKTPTASLTTPATLKTGQVIYRSASLDLSMAVVWSPDGSRVATVINRTQVESWDAQTGKNVLIYPIDEAFAVANVAWSPDGNSLAVAGTAKIYLFNAKTAQLIRFFSHPIAFGNTVPAPLTASITKPGASQRVLMNSTLPRAGASFGEVTWSSNGKYLATVSNSSQQMYVWDAGSGSLVKILRGVYTNNTRAIWSPSGTFLAIIECPDTNCAATQATIWDSTTWTVVKQYPNTFALDWSPDGKRLALLEAAQVLGKDVRIVDAFTGQTIKQFAGEETGRIMDVRWSPDSSRIALEYQGPRIPGSIKIWNVASGMLLYNFSNDDTHLPRWSPDSKYMSSVQTIRIGSGKDTRYSVQILIWVA